MLVGDIDEPVVAAAARTPFEARRRVFVIERAETMNEQSQNKMLKTLEEPASFAHLILLSSRPGKLLPTISSRCQLVRFDAPEPEAIAERLAAELGLDPAAADAAARLGLGDADRAADRERPARARRGVRAGRAARRPLRAALDGDARRGPEGGRPRTGGDRGTRRRRARAAAQARPPPRGARGRRGRQARAAARAHGRARPGPASSPASGSATSPASPTAPPTSSTRPTASAPSRRTRRAAPPIACGRPSRSSTSRARPSSSTRTRNCCSRRSPRASRGRPRPRDSPASARDRG